MVTQGMGRRPLTIKVDPDAFSPARGDYKWARAAIAFYKRVVHKDERRRAKRETESQW